MSTADSATPRGEPLAGRVAVVVGASRGIGAATARALSGAGAAVVAAARDERALAGVVDGITAAGGRALAVRTDVTDAASVRGLVDRTLAAYGRLDAAVNNAAGGGRRPTPLADIPVEDFDGERAVDLRGVFLGMKYEIPAMLENGGGTIVNMASTAAMHPVAGRTGYVVSKCGVIGLTRTAALDYAARGIRVNALAPGPTHTEVFDRVPEEARQRAAGSVPVRRLGSPDEVAAAVVWLCSPASSFVTGATLPVDGGMLAGMAPYGGGQGR